jgi:hypothetical protein
MTREGRRAVITNVIDDLLASDHGAVARAYLQIELRALIAEKVRRLRKRAQRR